MIMNTYRGAELFLDEKEIWVKHYTSFHGILLVGEGDFSFSLCLARFFGSGLNIVATSLDSSDEVIRKYKDAKQNLEILGQLRATIIHGVDVTAMKLCHHLCVRKFDRIIFNFPHAGFHGKEDSLYLIRKHRSLVYEFFKNASGMLRADGEIHVNHKTTPPFSNWNIKELAAQSFLEMIECVDFNKEDYPGYHNKRGDGSRCDSPFPLGKCSTFKFIISPAAKRFSRASSKSYAIERYPEQPQGKLYLHHIHRHPASIDIQPVLDPIESIASVPLRHNVLRSRIRDECCQKFSEYFNYVERTFGIRDYDLYNSVKNAIKVGYERFLHEEHGIPLFSYIDLLEELHHMSVFRSAWLGQKLSVLHLQS